MSVLPAMTAPVRYEAAELLELLRVLRQAPRDAAFWPRLCVAINALGRGRSAMRLSRQGDRWQPWALCAPPDGVLEAQAAQLLSLLIGRAARYGHATLAQGDDAIVACVRLLADDGELYALVEIPARERASLNELLLRLQLIADLPLSRQEPADTGTAEASGGAGASGAVDVHMLELLDLAARVMQEKKLGPAALALVNGLVPLTGCDQVVLGWKEVSYVRAKAISHLDRFERKAENVQLIEAALEEALDQQTDIVYPAPAQYGCVVLAHERLGRAINHAHMRSLVLHRADEAPEAVVLLAAQTDRFAPERMHQVSVAMHLMLPWLADLHQRDRWFGARWWQRVHHQAGQWFGPDKPVRTLGIGLASLLLLFVLVGTWPHRIEANAELVTDSTQLVSAPFDGFVQEVGVSLGDEVQANALLGRLDVRDLLLQESEIGADLRRPAPTCAATWPSPIGPAPRANWPKSKLPRPAWPKPRPGSTRCSFTCSKHRSRRPLQPWWSKATAATSQACPCARVTGCSGWHALKASMRRCTCPSATCATCSPTRRASCACSASPTAASASRCKASSRWPKSKASRATISGCACSSPIHLKAGGAPA